MAVSDAPENRRKPLSGPAVPSLGGFRSTKRALTDNLVKYVLLFCAVFSIIALFFIVFFLFDNTVPLIKQEGIWEILSGDSWRPYKDVGATFGAYNLIIATILVTIGAMVIAIPLGIGSAIFISQLAPSRVKDIMKTAVELLAGVPSVVYGLFGLIILVRWIKVGFDVPTGEGWLAASVLLGVMALPTIISVAEDAISSVTRDMKEASLALGATKWQTISKVLLPASISGITAAVILGIGRAVGETMAVMMVAGNTATIPSPMTDVFSTLKPITATIGIEMGESSGMHKSGLFALAVILFIMVLLINTMAVYIMGRIKRKHLGQSRKKGRFDIRIPDRVGRNFGMAVRIALLAFIGWLIISWFGVIVGMIILLALLGLYLGSQHLHPKRAQYVAYGVVSAAMLLTLAALGVILYYIISEGMGAMSWEFLAEAPVNQGLEGGIFPAIVGTIYLVLGAILLAMPLGVGAGIYLSEYAREGRLLRIIRLGIDNLNGTPSIVFGLFAWAFFVIYLEMGVSLQAGILVLSLMILPTIIRTTEEALMSVPRSMREGSLALGATKWETIRKVILPPAFPGIITGIILSIGRAAGESAPILFVASTKYSPGVVDQLDLPTMALSTHIFYMAKETPGGMENASGTALVLLIMIFIVYSSAAVLRRRIRKKNRW